jgi:hypothetical protein
VVPMLSYPEFPETPHPSKKTQKRTSGDMTIVIPSSPNNQPAKRGNGKTLKEMREREERKLAKIRFDQQATEAVSAAEEISKITEIRARQKDRVFEVYDKQEAKRAPQFQIDQAFTLWLLIGLAAVMFIATAVLTADGTIGAATSARYFTPALGYVLFGSIEVAVLVFMLLYYVRGSRVDYDGKRVSSWQWFAAMVAASVAAAGLSIYHVMDLYGFDLSSGEMWVGVGIRTITSVFFVLVSKGLASVIFAKAVQF